MTEPSSAPLRPDAGPADVNAGRWYGSATAGHRPADVQKHAWRVYFEATQMLEELLERRLKAECGMTLPDYNLLLLLTESDQNRLRLGELASRMVFSPSRVTYQVKSLVARGLIERRAAERDRRGYEAVLTDAGRSAFRRAAVIHARQVGELFLDRLEPGEAEVLARVFSRVGCALEAQC
ncbi:MarR family winged helix-turn-helix transcriptional regulator [Micrococcus lacusdianchii]|uniref:MarR family winged helix-turn-helix transcriptional regulator n=1 Tax=Micrococcus lacusdianchii TaxID=2915940 RepID=UPI002FFAD362